MSHRDERLDVIEGYSIGVFFVLLAAVGFIFYPFTLFGVIASPFQLAIENPTFLDSTFKFFIYFYLITFPLYFWWFCKKVKE